MSSLMLQSVTGALCVVWCVASAQCVWCCVVLCGVVLYCVVCVLMDVGAGAVVCKEMLYKKIQFFKTCGRRQSKNNIQFC